MHNRPPGEEEIARNENMVAKVATQKPAEKCLSKTSGVWRPQDRQKLLFSLKKSDAGELLVSKPTRLTGLYGLRNTITMLLSTYH